MSSERLESSKHILVVDDEIDLASSCQRLLQGKGYDVSVAASGEQALQHLEPGLERTRRVRNIGSGEGLSTTRNEERQLEHLKPSLKMTCPCEEHSRSPDHSEATAVRHGSIIEPRPPPASRSSGSR